MKFFRILGVLLALALLLSACGGQTTEVMTTHGNLIINTGNQTITHGSDVYRYSVSGAATTIHYPNGAVYHFSDTEQGWSYDYDPHTYIPGDVLYNALPAAASQPESSRLGQVVLGILCILLGGITVAFPKGMWFLAFGWRYRDSEPSQAALVMDRLGGGLLILTGILFLFA